MKIVLTEPEVKDAIKLYLHTKFNITQSQVKEVRLNDGGEALIELQEATPASGPIKREKPSMPENMDMNGGGWFRR